MSRRSFAIAWTILAAAATSGCRSVETPRLADPGTPEYQQYTMERFDPYPTTETAPEIVGARPREYLTPVPEPRRSRWDLRNWFPRFGL
jgi:hypothetical protein